MSIFSLPSSLVTARTRWPSSPMHAPLALTPGSVARTAILVRWPASRASETISTTPARDLGHLEREQLAHERGMRARHGDLTDPWCPCDTLVT